MPTASPLLALLPLFLPQAPASEPASRPAPVFEEVKGALGGPSYATKCEGVDVGDFDLDGKLDLVFATGFVLQPKRQPPLAPQLQMNRGKGSIAFADETGARLPKDFAVQAGSVTAFDIEADGDLDLLFAQMGGRPSLLLVNDGRGHFAESANFPTIAMSSASSEAGDVDADGDLDLVLTDQGRPTRLFVNDGRGAFAEATDAMPPIPVPVAQDATFVDIDSDFDLDLVVLGKHRKGQNLFLNDGKGRFTDATATLGYPGSDNNYECEWADLDDDGDLDAFWITLEAEMRPPREFHQREGITKNLLAESGKLSFEHTKETLVGHNDDDDNEVVLLDYDQDGRLDVVVGSLAYATEKLYRNAGGLRFEFVGGFDGPRDPTCDATAGDFDGDGRIDVATAQGESGAGNRVYRNTGAKDARAPRITRTRLESPAGPDRPWLVFAFVQDGSYDDGRDFLSCEGEISCDAKPGALSKVRLLPMGGHLFRGALDAAAVGAAKGSKVTYRVRARDGAGNEAATEPVTVSAP